MIHIYVFWREQWRERIFIELFKNDSEVHKGYGMKEVSEILFWDNLKDVLLWLSYKLIRYLKEYHAS